MSTSTHDPLKSEPHFTSREKAVLRLLVDGYRIEEAALRLEMALATVEQHLANIRAKLGDREGY